MSTRMQPSRIPAGDAPNVMNYPPDSSATFEKGAIVTLDAQGEVDEHGGGTTTTGIRGVALEGVSSGSPDNPGDEAAVGLADRNQVFLGAARSGTNAVLTDLSSITIGDQYGVVKGSDNIWYVDTGDTTNNVLEVVDVDDDIDVVFFKFLEAALDQP